MKYISTTLISFLFLLNSNLFCQAPIADFSFNPNGCVGVAHNFTDISANAPNSFYWTFGDGNSSTNQNPSNVYLTAGTYLVTFVAINANGSDTIAYNVTIYDNPIINAGTDQTICFGASIGLSASGGFTYNWTPPTGLSSTSIYNPTASLTSTTTYTVIGTDTNGCMNTDNITITVNPEIVLTGNVTNASCYGMCDGSITLTPSGGTPAYTYFWSPSGNTTKNITTLCTGTYTITVTDASGCTAVDSFAISEPVAGGTINGIVYYQTIPITSGVAELIRKDGSLPTDMTLVQTVNINPTSGEFIFFELPAANYIIKVLGDTTMYNCAATYYNLTAQWQLAQELTIASSCFDSAYVDIDLIELPSNSGTGAVNGRLVEGSGLFNKAPGEPLGDIDITLNQSPGGTIMAATTTDSLGYFTINNLPMGTYTVYADMMGYNVTLQTIDINATTPSYDVVLCSDTAIDMIDMCEMTVTSVKKVATTNQLSIYPNPAKDVVNIVYNGNEALNLEVTDITGKKIMSETLKTKTIDVTGLNQGLYFVRLYNQNNDFVQKLVVE